MRRGPLVAAVLSLSTLTWLVTGCGGDEPSSEGSMSSMSHDGDEAHEGRDPASGHGSMGHDEPSSPVVEGARRIEVDATSFAFDPSVITITAGEDVAIVLTSDDVLHDFSIEGLDVHVAAAAGETAEGGLRVDEPGEYAIACTVEGHRDAGMEGTLVVESA